PRPPLRGAEPVPDVGTKSRAGPGVPLARWAIGEEEEEEKSSTCRRDAQDQVEVSGEFADGRGLERGKVHCDGGPGLVCAQAAPDAIPVVARMAFDVALGRQEFAAVALDLEVDMGCAAGVGNRLDGAEHILTG